MTWPLWNRWGDKERERGGEERRKGRVKKNGAEEVWEEKEEQMKED